MLTTPLDISLATSGSAATINVDENDATGSIALTSVFGSTTISSGVTYSIIDNDTDATNNAFKIVGTNLVVDKVALLDHETSSTIDVKIKADTSDRTGTETFTVNINDVNDDPVAPTNLAFSIGAGAALGGATGYTFTATDEDVPANTIAYSMDNNAYFTMDNAGVITAKKALTNNDAGAQNLTVTFNDGAGSGDKTATVVGTITDNIAPTVENTVFTKSLSEDAVVGATVFTITGDDSDGDNTAITYGISGNSKFAVDASTGAVTLAAATLDHETVATETFSIFSIDEQNTQSIAKTVTVTVDDANDAPVFTSGATGNSLNETALVGATAYSSVTTDADAPADTISYELSGTDASKFAVDASTGVVTLNAVLDYETKATYEFTVKASDGNGGSSTVDVSGTVVDRLENPFKVTSSQLTSAQADAGKSFADGGYNSPIKGSAGDTLISITANFSDADTSNTYSGYEAIEKAEFNFSVDGVSDSDWAASLVPQLPIAGGEQKYGSASHTSASPSGDFDAGAVNTDMISGSSTTTVLHFVIDSSKVTADFDLEISGAYDFTDYGADNANGGGDDQILAATLDPFIFTVDIA